MDTPMTDKTEPSVPIQLKLAPELARRFEQELQAAALPAITAAVTKLFSQLGLPGRPELSWLPSAEALAARRPLEIIVHGRLCRHSDELMVMLWSYVQGKVARPLDTPGELQAWLASADVSLVAEWLALLCRHTLGLHAGVLLEAWQVRAYCARLTPPAGTPAPDPARLAPILAHVLNLGISIADHAAVAATFADGTASDDTLAEGLIAVLRPNRIEIRIERAYLRQLSINDGARAPELFAFLRDGLFVELGVVYPRFRIVPDETLRPGGIILTINHLPGVPFLGLPPDRILVNDTPERLRLEGIAAEPALNPATYLPCALAPLDAQQSIEASGLTTWDQLAFLILSFASFLRAESKFFIDRRLTQQMLQQLGEAFPALEQAANAHLSLDRLTAVLRGLIAEQISIRNLQRILGLLLEHELLMHAGASLLEQIGYVRAGLNEMLAYKYKRDQVALVVYLLDPGTERFVAAADGLCDDQMEQQLIDAFRAELDQLPPTAFWPTLLVSEAAYAPLQTMLAAELPRLRMLSYPQLPPDLNVQPVARIELVC
jgi:hypothetical protein